MTESRTESPRTESPESASPPRDERELQRACEEFMLLVDTPDANSLERMIARYPALATELTDFAVEWSTQDLQPAVAAGAGEAWEEEWDAGAWAEAEEDTSGSAVENAMARLRRQLADETADPFAAVEAGGLRGLAARLGLDLTLVAKLRHRRLQPATVPAALLRALADELESNVEKVRAYLESPPTVPAGVHFKAERGPEVGRQESFDEALRRSTLDAEGRRRWLEDG